MITCLTLSDFTNVATLLGAVIAMATLFYTAYQVRLNAKTNRAMFWLELEKMSKSHDQVHLNLRTGGKWADGVSCPANPEEWSALEDYMGLFEYCEIMMKMELIDISTFFDIFLYRLRNIVKNRSIVDYKLRKEAKSWRNFLDLLKRFDIPLPQEIITDSQLTFNF
jgi:hypothetical protein